MGMLSIGHTAVTQITSHHSILLCTAFNTTAATVPSFLHVVVVPLHAAKHLSVPSALTSQTLFISLGNPFLPFFNPTRW